MTVNRVPLGCLLAIVVFIFQTPRAWSWEGYQHQWIVSDAVEYMAGSGDPFLESIADYLTWAPGTNSLICDPMLEEEQRACWDPMYTVAGSALLALQYETSFTDKYSDMWVDIDTESARRVCSEYVAHIGWHGGWCIWDAWKCDAGKLACKALAGELMGMFPISHHGELNVTSLNHFIGAYYASDRVERSPSCASREEMENLGYRYKNLGVACDQFSEGDCRNDSADMNLLDKASTASDFEYLFIDPGVSEERYNGVTCHQHEDLVRGMNISEAAYLPIDSMAEFWMRHFEDELLYLGPALHAIQDAFEPHHNYVYMGRGHAVFEEWAEYMVMTRATCREEGKPCDSYLTDDLYDPMKVSEYLEWEYFRDEPELTENIVAENAMKAATWNYADEAPNQDDPTFSYALAWGLDNIEEAIVDYIMPYGWLDILALGHNLSVAGTVAMLRKAFQDYLEGWHQRGYCDVLYQDDQSAWNWIVPGPTAGSYLPEMVSVAGWYVYLGEGEEYTPPESKRGESRHPYYNDLGEDLSNRFVFHVPAEPTWQIDYITERIDITFSNSCDWHYQSEDDYLMIRTRNLELGLHNVLGPWQEFGRYYPHEVRGKTITITAPDNPNLLRLAEVEIQLVQGVSGNGIPWNALFVGGDFGEIWIHAEDSWTRMNSGTDERVNGIWGSSENDVFAVTSEGSVLHYDGNEAFAWDEVFRVPVDDGGVGPQPIPGQASLIDVNGSSSSDVWAVGWRDGLRIDPIAYHFDGTDWTNVPVMCALPSPLPGPIFFTSLNGVWSASPDDVFVVGSRGLIGRYNGEYFETTGGDESYDLYDVWGSSPDNVLAVGSDWTKLHYDGSEWTELFPGWGGPTHRGVWGHGRKVFVVGDDGIIERFDGEYWASMLPVTSNDLYDVWGFSTTDLHAVGKGGTVLHYDGGGRWEAIEGGSEVDLFAVWRGVQGVRGCLPWERCCSPGRKFGFKVDSIAVDFTEEHRSDQVPPDASDVFLGITDMLRDGYFGYLWEDIIDPCAFWECVPGNLWVEGLGQDFMNAFGPVFETWRFLENEQIFDVMHDALMANVPEPSVCPALSAYVIVNAAKAYQPDNSIIETGLADFGVWWSLWKQGAWPGRGGDRNSTRRRRQTLDFATLKIGSRPTEHRLDGRGLPAVAALDMSGYPGFREPTAEEKESVERHMEYLAAKRKHVDRYREQRRLEVSIENVDGLFAILDTDRSGNPAAEEKIEEIRARLVMIREALEADVDSDGDGVPDFADECPDECALGMDADRDGCIDSACGLEEEVLKISQGVRWWWALVRLGHKARQACRMEQRDKPRAVAGLLQAFDVLVRNYARSGWVEPDDAEHLRQYAQNARDAALGDLSRLECP